MTLHVENLNTLIAHLEAPPPKRFNMRYVFRGTNNYSTWNVPSLRDCGTAACIAGHCAYAAGIEVGREYLSDQAAVWLGLRIAEQSGLFMPPDYYGSESDRYPLSRAIATLKRLRDHYLATGKVVVDWGPEPDAEPAQAWATPRAVEIAEPVLPATLTDLLCAAPAAPATLTGA